jgi:hypothetical protein
VKVRNEKVQKVVLYKVRNVQLVFLIFILKTSSATVNYFFIVSSSCKKCLGATCTWTLGQSLDTLDSLCSPQFLDAPGYFFDHLSLVEGRNLESHRLYQYISLGIYCIVYHHSVLFCHGLLQPFYNEEVFTFHVSSSGRSNS